jgi:hypothetical protein
MRRSSPTTRYDYSPVGTVWPSGDFSLGYRRLDWHGGGRADFRSEVTRIDDGDYVLGEGWEYHGNGHTTFDGTAVPSPSEHFLWPDLATTPSDDTSVLWPDVPGEASWGEAALDLTSVPNSHKPPNRPEKYGKLGQTGYGKKMVRSACALLERRYKGRLTFATVTMPNLPRELRRELALAWGEFVRQALQWLSRRLKSKGLPAAVCSVTEVQPKRLQAGNGGYLHLHMVWPNHKTGKGDWAIDCLEFRAWCESFLLRRGLLPDSEWVNVDTQRVTKSAAAYLSKYMSKGGDILEAFAAENGWDAVPGQWWNLTKPLRNAVKREIIKGEDVGLYLENLIDYLFNTGDFSPFWAIRTVDMELDGRAVTVGYCGSLRADIVSDLLSMSHVATTETAC